MPEKILAIDDSPTLRKFITKHLSGTEEAYEVDTAPNGEEGVTRALEMRPDLILLDFILPDFNGDQVCERLMENPEVAATPVILMSSSAPDIEKTEKAYGCIARSIVKPFSPQLLASTVKEVLEARSGTPAPGEPEPVTTPAGPEAPAAAPPEPEGPFLKAESPEPAPPRQKPAVVIPQHARVPKSAPTQTPPPEPHLLCGDTSYFSLASALRGVAQEKRDGVMEFQIGKTPLLLYTRFGKPCLVASRDPEAYFSGGQLEVDDDSRPYFEELKQKQEEDGQPLFLRMGEEGALPREEAESLTRQYGNFYFASLWSRHSTRFHFQPLASLPAFCPPSPLSEEMDHWILETLRCLPPDAPVIAEMVGESDTPQLNPRGYGLVHTLPLDEEEVTVIQVLSQTALSVEGLAAESQLPMESVRTVLFRLYQMNILDVWSTPTE